MKQELHSPEVYDFRQYDRVWQRVRPGLEPYPAADSAPGQAADGAQPRSAVTGTPAGLWESQLPGAEMDPCCMGTEAAELLAVLEGYIGEEWEARRWYLALSRQAPVWARQTLRELAADEGRHAQHLTAVCYLITGRRVHPETVSGQRDWESWSAALRRGYHEEVCTAMNYARSADSTPDVCLSKLLTALSEEEYRHADRLLALLERSLPRQGC